MIGWQRLGRLGLPAVKCTAIIILIARLRRAGICRLGFEDGGFENDDCSVKGMDTR